MKTGDDFDYTYISLGAGKQSTAMAILAARGERGIPKPDVAIFADTGDEIRDTYKHLDRFGAWLEERGIPVITVKQGHLGKELVGMKAKSRSDYIVSIPAFTMGEDGKEGRLRRQCTNEYKIVPIEREVRRLLGFKKGERIAGKKRVRNMIGLSVDEIYRVKPSRAAWITRHHPLIDARMNVHDCAKVCEEHLGYVPVKSACGYCPYHDDRYWAWLKRERPDEFEKAVRMDEGIRNLRRAGVTRPVYLHRSLKPLREVDFEPEKASGQLSLWNEECDAVCGV